MVYRVLLNEVYWYAIWVFLSTYVNDIKWPVFQMSSVGIVPGIKQMVIMLIGG